MTQENGSTGRPEAEIHSYIANDIDTDGMTEGEDYIVTTVGSTKKCLQKYETVWLVPNVRKMIEEGKKIEDLFDFFEDRNITGQDVINKAMSNFSYRVKNQDAFDFDAEPTKTEDPDNPSNPFIDYPLKSGGFRMLQDMANEWKAGQRAASVGKVQKKQAVKYSSLEEKAKAAGYESPEDMIAALLEQQS